MELAIYSPNFHLVFKQRQSFHTSFPAERKHSAMYWQIQRINTDTDLFFYGVYNCLQ